MNSLKLSTFALAFLCLQASCTEFTFELRERRKDCFYEKFESDDKAQIDFRVLSGGNVDINVRLFDPDGEPVFSADKKTQGGRVFSVTKPGIYRACFSNEFSALARKLVYFALRSGREESESLEFPDLSSSSSSSSLDEDDQERRKVMLDSMQIIGANLVSISNYQRRMRLNEAADRLAAEATLGRVGAWSLVEIFGVVSAAAAQVLAVRRLFQTTSSGTAAPAGLMGRRA
ncbi:hypothetical protein BOX15_Mlig022161g1 [Macrostomum lignano]|uniref:Uncharacterized protein n=2 Tax=Macrostomum lignano TaxID=282301 RepID=A0A267H434_9PLAT|nr:hypothetical protein BOX15_Mlig022161g1 [Macrostomum lignano]